MELIVISNNGIPMLRSEVAFQIAEFERKVKAIQEMEKDLKQAIMDEMEAKNIIGLESPDLRISYVSAFDRETFDSKAFRKEHPDMYDDYVRISTVKPSLKIKVRDLK